MPTYFRSFTGGGDELINCCIDGSLCIQITADQCASLGSIVADCSMCGGGGGGGGGGCVPASTVEFPPTSTGACCTPCGHCLHMTRSICDDPSGRGSMGYVFVGGSCSNVNCAVCQTDNCVPPGGGGDDGGTPWPDPDDECIENPESCWPDHEPGGDDDASCIPGGFDPPLPANWCQTTWTVNTKLTINREDTSYELETVLGENTSPINLSPILSNGILGELGSCGNPSNVCLGATNKVKNWYVPLGSTKITKYHGIYATHFTCSLGTLNVHENACVDSVTPCLGYDNNRNYCADAQPKRVSKDISENNSAEYCANTSQFDKSDGWCLAKKHPPLQINDSLSTGAELPVGIVSNASASIGCWMSCKSNIKNDSTGKYIPAQYKGAPSGYYTDPSIPTGHSLESGTDYFYIIDPVSGSTASSFSAWGDLSNDYLWCPTQYLSCTDIDSDTGIGKTCCRTSDGSCWSPPRLKEGENPQYYSINESGCATPDPSYTTPISLDTFDEFNIISEIDYFNMVCMGVKPSRESLFVARQMYGFQPIQCLKPNDTCECKEPYTDSPPSDMCDSPCKHSCETNGTNTSSIFEPDRRPIHAITISVGSSNILRVGWSHAGPSWDPLAQTVDANNSYIAGTENTGLRRIASDHLDYWYNKGIKRFIIWCPGGRGGQGTYFPTGAWEVMRKRTIVSENEIEFPNPHPACWWNNNRTDPDNWYQSSDASDITLPPAGVPKNIATAYSANFDPDGRTREWVKILSDFSQGKSDIEIGIYVGYVIPTRDGTPSIGEIFSPVWSSAAASTGQWNLLNKQTGLGWQFPDPENNNEHKVWYNREILPWLDTGLISSIAIDTGDGCYNYSFGGMQPNQNSGSLSLPPVSNLYKWLNKQYKLLTGRTTNLHFYGESIPHVYASFNGVIDTLTGIPTNGGWPIYDPTGSTKEGFKLLDPLGNKVSKTSPNAYTYSGYIGVISSVLDKRHNYTVTGESFPLIEYGRDVNRTWDWDKNTTEIVGLFDNCGHLSLGAGYSHPITGMTSGHPDWSYVTQLLRDQLLDYFYRGYVYSFTDNKRSYAVAKYVSENILPEYHSINGIPWDPPSPPLMSLVGAGPLPCTSASEIKKTIGGITPISSVFTYENSVTESVSITQSDIDTMLSNGYDVFSGISVDLRGFVHPDVGNLTIKLIYTDNSSNETTFYLSEQISTTSDCLNGAECAANLAATRFNGNYIFDGYCQSTSDTVYNKSESEWGSSSISDTNIDITSGSLLLPTRGDVSILDEWNNNISSIITPIGNWKIELSWISAPNSYLTTECESCFDGSLNANFDLWQTMTVQLTDWDLYLYFSQSSPSGICCFQNSPPDSSMNPSQCSAANGSFFINETDPAACDTSGFCYVYNNTCHACDTNLIFNKSICTLYTGIFVPNQTALQLECGNFSSPIHQIMDPGEGNFSCYKEYSCCETDNFKKCNNCYTAYPLDCPSGNDLMVDCSSCNTYETGCIPTDISNCCEPNCLTLDKVGADFSNCCYPVYITSAPSTCDCTDYPVNCGGCGETNSCASTPFSFTSPQNQGSNIYKYLMVPNENGVPECIWMECTGNPNPCILYVECQS